jgi:diguanylate cyclase (GGDEF)-like protein
VPILPPAGAVGPIAARVSVMAARQRNGRARRLGEILGVAAVYFIAGRVAVLLAIPPGYATAIWPAAGFALAGVLLLGSRVWPGILLGSFAVNVATGFDARDTVSLAWSLLLPLAIAAGAVSQARLGARLVRRFTTTATALGPERDLLRFLALGGPVSCLVNASVSVASLALAGKIGAREIPFSWWTWWVGDTIGVLVFAPLVLMWAPGTAQIGLRRRIWVSVPLCCTFALVVLLFVRTSAWEQNQIDLGFERQADDLAHKLNRDIESNLEVLDFVGGFFSSGAQIGRSEIRVFTRQLLSRHPDIEALYWTPYAPGDPGATDAQRVESVPLQCIEPCEENGEGRSFDAALDARAIEALRRARDTGRRVAAVDSRLEAGAGDPSAVPFFLPVYAGGPPPATVEERRERWRGFAAGTFRIGDMLEAALGEVETGEREVRLLDVTDARATRCLFTHPPGEDRPADAPRREGGASSTKSKSSRLAVGGRRWVVELSIPPSYLTTHRSWQPWSLLAGGFLFTGVLGAFLLVVTGRTVRVEETVAQRTHELRRANEVLKRETAKRITAQKIANIDPLTELLNRRGLEAELSREIRRGCRTDAPLAAVLLDCDDFKRINETLGHAVGDVVLKEIASRLRDSLRPTDHLARIGGDEFLVLLPDTRMAEAMHAAERLRLAVSDNPLRLASGPVKLTASLGIERVPMSVVSIEEVLARTHFSLRYSKQAGKNRISSRGGKSAIAEPALSNVVQALRKKESYRAVKQAIVSLADESVVGWELLSRGPRGSFEMPYDFFRVALERNILTLVDLHCLRACIEASKSLPTGTTCHVNLLPSTMLSTPEERLVELFPPAGGGRKFCVEVSEQQFIGDPACLRGSVRALKRFGVQVAIDDVGFGRSSLETLIILEPDVVKIDQRIVKGASRDKGKEQLLRRLVKVVGAMGSELVAEGIESREDLGLLREVGVPLGQGFLWGRPG